jgi:pantetheine-phosphate adenylyltransferase
MFRVILPGTFDPPTNGHLNILQRASGMFDAVEVVIADNPAKARLFGPEERFAMMESLSRGLANVTVRVWNGLIVDFADKIGVHVILRGVRELSLIYRSLNPRIETIFIPTDKKYSILRSSTIKEVARLGGDVTAMVPAVVAAALAEKLGSPSARRPPGVRRG